MKVYLGSIAWRGYEYNYARSLVMLMKKYPQVAVLPQVGDALVERSRSIVATHFLRETDADVLLTIDSDISFNPDQAMHICQQAHDLGAIVVGAYNTRSFDKKKPTSELWPGQQVVFGNDPTPVAIQYGASGFMAISRKVLEALAEKMPLLHANESWQFYPFYHTEIVEDSLAGPILLSEDFAFCAKAREAGFDTYLNPAVRLGHMGDHIYTLEDMAWAPPVKNAGVRLTKAEDRHVYTVEVATDEPTQPANRAERRAKRGVAARP